MGGITYDTTVLIAAERGDRQMWAATLVSCGWVPFRSFPRRCSLKRGAVGPVKRCSRGCWQAARSSP